MLLLGGAVGREKNGGSVGGDFGVATCLILYWCIC